MPPQRKCARRSAAPAGVSSPANANTAALQLAQALSLSLAERQVELAGASSSPKKKTRRRRKPPSGASCSFGAAGANLRDGGGRDNLARSGGGGVVKRRRGALKTPKGTGLPREIGMHRGHGDSQHDDEGMSQPG